MGGSLVLEAQGLGSFPSVESSYLDLPMSLLVGFGMVSGVGFGLWIPRRNNIVRPMQALPQPLIGVSLSLLVGSFSLMEASRRVLASDSICIN